MRQIALLCLLFTGGCNAADRILERMVNQPRIAPNSGESIPTPLGVVPRERSLEAESADAGPRLTVELLDRGRNRFDIYCAACHGVGGDAQTPVADRMALRRPPSLFEPRLIQKTPAEIYRVIREGYGFMPSYAAQLPDEDRWATTAYVKALQLSRAVPMVALPGPLQEEARAALR